MTKQFLGVRIDATLKEKLDEQAKEKGETVTELTERALASYLSVDISRPDIYDIEERLKALESKFKRTPSPPQKTTPKKKDNSDKTVIKESELGELVTLDEMEALTGYSKSTLSGKLSREKVTAVKRVDGNRAGLYDKSEVLDKIGINPNA